MSCPRCNSKTEVFTEDSDPDADSWIIDYICRKCNSVIVETFYNDGRYKSDWIDLDV